MNILMNIGRLKILTDSVLLVGIVLLVYNLASLAATKLYDFDQQTFFNTLVAYVDSFIAVFVYWSIFSIILSCFKQLNEIIFLLSISILIFVTLIPVAHEGLLQLKKPSVFYFAYTIFITPGILLIALLVYTEHKVQLHDISLYNLVAASCVIPGICSIYIISVFFAPTFINFIPFSIFPILYILGKIFRRRE